MAESARHKFRFAKEEPRILVLVFLCPISIVSPCGSFITSAQICIYVRRYAYIVVLGVQSERERKAMSV